MNGMLAGLWRYRGFVLSSTVTDFRLRVSRSRLGVLWIVIAPLAQVAIFALILSALMTERLPGIDNQYAYAIYLISGFLAWSLFVEIMTRSVTMFIDNANAMKKIVFPKISLPIIIYLVALINNAIFFLAVAAVYVALGHGFSSAILWLPAVVLLTSLFAASIGLVLGVLNVFIRDIGQLVPILLQLGFWFTPIVYFPTIVPELYRDVLKLNPLYWVVDCYHRVLAFQQPPDMQVMLGLSALTLVIAALGIFLFRRASAEMVDVL